MECARLAMWLGSPGRRGDIMRVQYDDPFIREAIAADDHFRAEAASWSPAVQKSQGAETTESEPAATPYPAFDDLIEYIAEFVVTWCNKKLALRDAKIAKLKKDLALLCRQVDLDRNNGIEIVCTGIERRFALLEAENVELRGMLGEMLTRFVEHRGEPSADVVELIPNWRRHDAA